MTDLQKDVIKNLIGEPRVQNPVHERHKSSGLLDWEEGLIEVFGADELIPKEERRNKRNGFSNGKNEH